MIYNCVLAHRPVNFPHVKLRQGCKGNPITCDYFFGDTIMKNLGKYISAIFMVFAFSSLIACSSNANKGETAGQYIDDSVITTKVKAAILKEDTLKVAEINVETYQGVVQLSGFVNSKADISTAVRVASGINGVKSVKNDMRTK